MSISAALIGEWHNAKAKPSGLARLVITAQANRALLRAYATGPSGLRDLGPAEADVYQDDASGPGNGLLARLDLDGQSVLLAAYVKGGVLCVSSFTRFSDGDRHKPCYAREFFHRVTPRLDLAPLLGRWRNTWSRTPTIQGLRLAPSRSGLSLVAEAAKHASSPWGEALATPCTAARDGTAASGFTADFAFDEGAGARLGASLGSGLLSIMIFRWDTAGVRYTREFFHRVEGPA